MTEITMQIEVAEGISGEIARFIEYVHGMHNKLIAEGIGVDEVWKCDAELEFQDLHTKLLIEVDKRINALANIRSGLDYAITDAKRVDRKFQ